MSGGMKLSQKSFFAGSGAPTFPKGVHTKMESSADGVGGVSNYQDTTEAIRKSQVDASGKVRGHQGKLPEYRN